MRLRNTLCLMILALASVPALAQDAAKVVADASKAMGLTGLNSLYYYGSGANYSIGQNNNSNIPWPQTALNEYVRAIDFTVPASRATWTTYATPVTGGAPVLANPQQNITPTSAGGWGQQLEIWTTPWGFLKGAAANGATVKSQTIDGKPYRVVTFNSALVSPGGKPYPVTGYINANNLVERVQTWLEHPVFGDMLVESKYSFYRDHDGLMYPTEIVQERGGWPVFKAQILGAFPNPAKLAQLMTPPPPPAGAPAGGPPPGAAPAPTTSEQLAPGVFRIKGAYNSMAVEFADYVVLFEPGPQNEARALAGIAETKRLFPNKPIRYGVITHHHIDHTGGIAAVASEGITIVTPEVNMRLPDEGADRTAHLRARCAVEVRQEALIEGFKGDKRVFQDATRTLEVHVIKGLPACRWPGRRLAAEGKDPGLCRHVQLPAGRQAGRRSASHRHQGVLREHHAAGIGPGEHTVHPHDEP